MRFPSPSRNFKLFSFLQETVQRHCASFEYVVISYYDSVLITCFNMVKLKSLATTLETDLNGKLNT